MACRACVRKEGEGLEEHKSKEIDDVHEVAVDVYVNRAKRTTKKNLIKCQLYVRTGTWKR